MYLCVCVCAFYGQGKLTAIIESDDDFWPAAKNGKAECAGPDSSLAFPLLLLPAFPGCSFFPRWCGVTSTWAFWLFVCNLILHLSLKFFPS